MVSRGNDASQILFTTTVTVIAINVNYNYVVSNVRVCNVLQAIVGWTSPAASSG